jgi:hypothetical protein
LNNCLLTTDRRLLIARRRAVGRRPFLIHLAHEEIVEAGADDGDGSEFADPIPGGRDGRGEDVRAELEFEREGEKAREREPRPAVIAPAST